MDRRRYLTYSGIGAVLWAGGVTLLGYWLGSVQFVRDNVDVIFAIAEVVIVGVVLLSVTPILLDAWRRRRRRAAQKAQLPHVEQPERAER
jgi:membrane-associated protein